MKKFFLLIGKIFAGLVTFFQVAILLLLIVIGAVALSSQQPVVPDSGALIVSPAGRLTEQLEGNMLDRAFSEYQGIADLSLIHISEPTRPY